MRTTMMTLAAVAGLGFALTGRALAEDVKSLRGTAIEQSETAPDLYRLQDGQKLDRAYRQAPPLVPHTTGKYEVDLKVNQCLSCHEWPNSDREKAPKISDSHYVDAKGLHRDQIVGNRYFCTQCHVEQADAKPLVDNFFKPAAPSR